MPQRDSSPTVSVGPSGQFALLDLDCPMPVWPALTWATHTIVSNSMEISVAQATDRIIS